jgi:hypothetical protein
VRKGGEGGEFRRDQNLCVLLAVTAYMLHPMALLYFIWIAADQLMLWLNKRQTFPKRMLVIIAVSVGVMVLPWYLWGINAFDGKSIFTPPSGIREAEHTIGSYFVSRGMMILNTLFVPHTKMLDFFQIGSIPIDEHSRWMYRWGNYALLAYFETFLAGFTLIGMLFFLPAAGMFRKVTLNGFGRLMILTALGSLTIILVNLKIHGSQAFNMLGPLAIATFIFLISRAAEYKRWVMVVMTIGMLCEYVGIRLLMYKLTSLYSHIITLLNAREVPFLFGVVRQSFPNVFLVVPVFLGVLWLVYLWLLSRLVFRNYD